MDKNDAGQEEGIKLGQIWNKLNAVTLKLWQEDRVAAVGLQAVIEEFRGEIARAEQLLEGLRTGFIEQQRTMEAALEARTQQEKTRFQDTIRQLERDVTTLRESLHEEQSRREDITRCAYQTERQLDDFKENSMKREAELDNKHAQKMRDLFEELQQKEAVLENFWNKQRHEWEEDQKKQLADIEQQRDALNKRSKELEMAHQEKTKEMQAKYETLAKSLRERTDMMEMEYSKKSVEMVNAHHALKKDIDSREAKILEWETSIRQREAALELHGRELEALYKKKNDELEKTKEQLKTEVAKIVGEYRTKQSGGPAARA